MNKEDKLRMVDTVFGSLIFLVVLVAGIAISTNSFTRYSQVEIVHEECINDECSVVFTNTGDAYASTESCSLTYDGFTHATATIQTEIQPDTTTLFVCILPYVDPPFVSGDYVITQVVLDNGVILEYNTTAYTTF